MPPASEPDDRLLTQAADWFATLHYGEPDDAERRAFEAWRQRSPAHEAAWQRIGSALQPFDPLPADIGRPALAEMDRARRQRRTRRRLIALAAAAPAVWLAARQAPWQRWTRDIATAVGEQRSVALPDGSQLMLDTASAVDIDFDEHRRRLVLQQGRILVSAVADRGPTERPFVVETARATLSTWQARFSVLEDGDAAGRLVVLDREVEVLPRRGLLRTVQAPGQTGYDEQRVNEPTPARGDPSLWSRGRLLAIDQTLAEVLAELARYRPGLLRWDPAVAQLRVSGALALGDTEAGLRLLADTLPIRIVRRTRYWVTVLPRG